MKSTKGLKRVYWSVLFLINGFWFNPKLYMSKFQLKKFLREFNAKDYINFGEISSVKILRYKRLCTSSMWSSESFGYTDVNSFGTLYYIDL